jgi:phage shock protein C
MKVCKKCGYEIKGSPLVCPNCGHRTYLRRFYRSRHDKKLLGICGGLGEYFDIDPNLIRVIVALIILWTGIIPGLIVYLLLGLFIPYSD